MCRHILFALKSADVCELPRCFVLPRWSKDAAKKHAIDLGGNPIQLDSRSTSPTVKINELWLEI